MKRMLSFLTALVLAVGLYLFSASPALAFFQRINFNQNCGGSKPNEYTAVSVVSYGHPEPWTFAEVRWYSGSGNYLWAKTPILSFQSQHRLDYTTQSTDIAYAEVTVQGYNDLAVWRELDDCYSDISFDVICTQTSAKLRWSDAYQGNYRYIIEGPAQPGGGYSYSDDGPCNEVFGGMCDSRPITLPPKGTTPPILNSVRIYGYLGLGSSTVNSYDSYPFSWHRRCPLSESGGTTPAPTLPPCASPNQCLSLSSCPQARQVAGFSCANPYEVCCAPAAGATTAPSPTSSVCTAKTPQNLSASPTKNSALLSWSYPSGGAGGAFQLLRLAPNTPGGIAEVNNGCPMTHGADNCLIKRTIYSTSQLSFNTASEPAFDGAGATAVLQPSTSYIYRLVDFCAAGNFKDNRGTFTTLDTSSASCCWGNGGNCNSRCQTTSPSAMYPSRNSCTRDRTCSGGRGYPDRLGYFIDPSYPRACSSTGSGRCYRLDGNDVSDGWLYRNYANSRCTRTAWDCSGVESEVPEYFMNYRGPFSGKTGYQACTWYGGASCGVSPTPTPTSVPTPTPTPPAGWFTIEDPTGGGLKTSGTVYAREDISVIDTPYTPLAKYVVNGKALVLPQQSLGGDSAFGKDGGKDISYPAHDPAKYPEWTARGYMSTSTSSLLNSGLSYESLKKLVKNLDTTKTSINDPALYTGEGGFELTAAGDKTYAPPPPNNPKDGRTIVFIESGDLRINQDLRVNKGAALIFVVQGKIIIDPGVKTVEAMLISFSSAGDAISTGTKGQGEDNGFELTISGGALAINGGLKLERSLPADQIKNKPSETFAFEPKFAVLMPEVFGEADFLWQETAP